MFNAIERWPNVPSVFGWLQLDQRGRWLIKNEPITHAGLIEFIGSNYQQDEQGRWFFQNGPQRVFIELSYTPWVYSIEADWPQLVTHTDQVVKSIVGGWLDELSTILLQTEWGVGVMLDRDLPKLMAYLVNATGQSANEEELQAALNFAQAAIDQPSGLYLAKQGELLPLLTMQSNQVSQRFQFMPSPSAGIAICVD